MFPRGPNSTIHGLISTTGVPSIASRPATRTVESLTSRMRHTVTPSRFGRSFARCANMPTSGQSLLPLGCRDIFESSQVALSNTYTTMQWEKSASPNNDLSSNGEVISMREVSTSHESSSGSLRELRTIPTALISNLLLTHPTVIVSNQRRFRSVTTPLLSRESCSGDVQIPPLTRHGGTSMQVRSRFPR